MSNNFSASISLNAGQSNKSITTLTRNVATLSKELDRLDSSIKKSEGSLSNLARHLGVARGATQQAAKVTKELVEQRRAEKASADAAAGSEKKLATSVGASAKATEQAATAAARQGQAASNAAQGAQHLGAAQTEVAQRTRAAQGATDAYSESLASHRYLMYDVGDTYRTMSVALLAIPAASSAAAIAYEKDFAQVQRTTGLAGDEAAAFAGELRQLATEIPATFSEISEAAKIGGQMDVADQALGNFTETVIKFVATSDNVNVDKAATAFGRLENMFNRTPTGELADPMFFERIGSAISYTGDNSVATEQAIIGMLEKTTASAKNAGLSIQETIAMSSAMVSSGLQPFLSSGFIIRFFGNFQKAAAAGGESAAAMARELGVTAEEFQNMVRNDPYQILHRVVTQMKDMDSVQGKQFLTRLGINGVQDPKVLNALSENLHVLDKAMGDVNESFASADHLDKSSEGIFNTTAANIQKLINAFMNLGSTIGQSGLPVFNHFLKAGIQVVSFLDDFISNVKAAQWAVGLLFGVMTARGIMLGFQSVLAFINASLVMFQDAAQKGALAGGRFGTMGQQVAKIMLYNKGATEQQVSALLKNKGATDALRTAIAVKRGALAKDTAATQANTGAQAANTAAKARAAGATQAEASAHAVNTTAIMAASSATGKHAGQLGFAAKAAGKFSGAMQFLGGAFGGLLNPAFLVSGAVISLGAALINARADINTHREGIGELIASYQEFEGAYDAVLKKMEEREIGKVGEWFTSDNVAGKNLLELAQQAGITGEQLKQAFENGSEGLLQLADDAEKVKKELWRTGDTDAAYAQADALQVVQNELKNYADEVVAAEEAKKRFADMGGEVPPVVNEQTEALEGLNSELDETTTSISDAIDVIFGFVNAEGAMTTALENMGKSLAESADMSTATSEGVNNIQNYQRVVSSALELMNQEIKEGAWASTEEAAAYYTAMFQGLEEQLTSMGVDPTQAQLMTEQALAAMQMVLDGGGVEGGANLIATMDVDSTPAYDTTSQTMLDMSEIINSSTFELHLDADGQPATENTWAVVNWIAEMMGITPEAVLDAIDGTATENTEAVWEYIVALMEDEYTAQLNADGSAGYTNVGNFYNWAMDRLDEISSGINHTGSGLNSLISHALSAGVNTVRNLFGGVSGPSRGRVTTSMTPAQAAVKRTRNAAPATPKTPKSDLPSIPTPNFDALKKGYNNAAKGAKKAGGAGKKAGNAGKKGADAAKKATDKAAKAAEKAAQQARDWNKAWQDLQSWASRVGEALSMAFDQKHAVQSAKDDYYSVLNGINDRLKQQKDRIKELREETKRLNAERKVELNEAKKFENMAAIADKHGNTDRAKDYRDQAKAMRERANEMSSQISANKAEQSTIQAGIGNLKGYSQAAIDNRNELRQLEQAALKVPQAYASIGSSAATVAKQTRTWTGYVKTHARQMGYTNRQVADNTQATSRYIRELNRVPRNIPTVVKASHSGVPAVNRALNNVAKGRNATIGARTGTYRPTNNTLNNVGKTRNARMNAYATNGANVNKYLSNLARRRTAVIEVIAKAMSSARKLVQGGIRGLLGWNEGGLVQGFNSGGLIPGQAPANPREDNLLASVDNNGLIAVRSKEYIVQQPAVDYYGLDFMNRLNNMSLPKYWAGGQVGGRGSSGDVATGTITLSAESLNHLARIMANQKISLQADGQALARNTQENMTILNQKRGQF